MTRALAIDKAAINAPKAHRGYVYKIYATPAQEELFRQFAGVCRLIYNLGLEQRRDHWRKTKITYLTQAKELTELRREYDFIRNVVQTCEQQALRDLDSAFLRFFQGLAKYPKPRRKEVDDTFRFAGREVQFKKLNAKWSLVKLPKIGWVKYRDTRPLGRHVRNATLTRRQNGWHIAVCCSVDDTRDDSGLSVGIDRGVAHTLTLSDGRHMDLPETIRLLDLKKRAAQKILSRRERGSKRYAKARRQMINISARIARIRSDWLHRTSTDITRTYGTVVIEHLRIKDMTRSARGTVEAPGKNVAQKRGLNRSILSQGWHMFETMLVYKAANLIKVPAAYTSQTCSICKSVHAESRKSQASFVCVECGFVANADFNAALNILDRGNTPDVERAGMISWKRELLLGTPAPKSGGDVKTEREAKT